MMHGEGVFNWPDGRKYIGHYQNDLRTGYGEMQHPSGNVFKGEWRRDVEHGSGSLHLKNGQIVSGVWRNGMLSAEEEQKQETNNSLAST